MGEAGPSSRVLLTFDVDGTLIQSIGTGANKFHKDAFSYAMQQLWGVEGTIDVIKHHGSTDKQVLMNTLAFYGIPEEVSAKHLEEGCQKMLEYAASHEADVRQGLVILPGVAELLAKLHKRGDTVIGLVTGNLTPIGWAKMRGLGIHQYFSTPNFGGFGTDHVDRGELVKIARQRAEELFPGGFRLHAHIGDTPADIRAALYGGAHAIGVTTGVFNEEDLREAGKEAPASRLTVLPGLHEHEMFLQTCGLC